MNAPVRDIAPISFHDGKVVLYPGDCMALLALLPDNSVDAVCTDPPYHLTSIVKRFGAQNAAPAKGNSAFIRASRGFMGRTWDGGDIAFTTEVWAEVLRVLKPGGHMVAFSGTRTYHRMACAIEDAGFEIRDQLAWTYGSGFPKSHDVSKGIDRAAGIDREDKFEGSFERRAGPTGNRKCEACGKWLVSGSPCRCPRPQDEPQSDAAREWRGWGTALKPAWEPICLARKPLSEGTIAANVLKSGTGAINVGACRVALNGEKPFSYPNGAGGSDPNHMWRGREKGDGSRAQEGSQLGRFPANLVHDGSPEVLAGFPKTTSGNLERSTGNRQSAYGFGVRDGIGHVGDSGSAARFFACFQDVNELRCDLCNATIAESSSSIESIPIDAIARGDAPASELRDAEGKRSQSSDRANDAEHSFSNCHPQAHDFAQKSVRTWLLSNIAQNVKRAAALCDSCATDIAVGIAEARHNGNVGRLHFRCSIDESKKTILSRSLARYVAGRENTDIILTIESLKELFGSAFHAIAENINSAKVGSEASIKPAPLRLFYSSKADADDRLGSKHPTVKPVDLMQWLVRLICPKGGTVLDPFAGTGTTGAAAFIEGCRAILMEREAEYQADIARRMELLLSGPDERSRKLTTPEPVHGLPLFAESAS